MEYQKSRWDVLAKIKKDKTYSKKSEQEYQLQNSFIFDSSDRYIKKILTENSWKIIPGQAKSFSLKWIYMPKHNTFSELTENQRINHFPHTHILTTKLGLKRTLTSQRSASVSWKGKAHGHFFPRSYDLSEEFDIFQKDFTRTAVSNLVKKIMIAIELQSTSLFHHLSQSIFEKKGKEQDWLKEVRQLLDYDLIWEKDPAVLKSYKLRLNSKVFQPLLCYLSIIFTLDSTITEQDFSPKELKYLSNYSLHNPPYNNLHQHFEGNKQLAKLPSLSAIKLFFHLYKKCYDSWSWFKSDGLRNIWVIKTSDSSRGRSIFLVQSLDDARSLNNGMRLIQKYIEDVWIYRPNPAYKRLSTVRRLQNKKFDIRLWVTVKSFAPLQAFIFQEGYLRISQNQYQLMDISNQKSHLTNFSVNWSQNDDNQDSYVLLSDFLAFLESNNLKSANLLREEIQEVIIQTLYSAQLLTNSGDNRCFQLFGFDIILDGDLKPWLLQCNMSPACKQRGILVNILQQMGTGLLSLHGIIGKNPLQKKWKRITPLFYVNSLQKPKQLSKFSKENVNKQLYKSQNSIKSLKKCGSLIFGESSAIMQQSRINSLLPAIPNSSFHNEDKGLIIVGTKLNKKSFTKLDTSIRVLQATIKIQRYIRNHKPKEKQLINKKPSLSWLKMIQVIAKILKCRKDKYFRSIKRYTKKSKLKNRI